jgi:5'-deoxynucleotidase YfbR-like HD superfamily hydrolase
MATKESFINDMKTRLETRQKEIAELKSKAESAGTGSKIDLNKKIAELELKQEYARKTLAELQSADEGQYESLKNSVETAWNDLDESYREALTLYK